jgi:hypothetical protein
MTYGLDIFVPGERGLASIVGDLAADRVKMLTKTRGLVLEELKRRVAFGKIRTETSNIEVGDLVLVKECRKTGKSEWSWSLPMRVLMKTEGRCRCQSLLTGQFVERDLSHLRKISPPRLQSQVDEWIRQLQALGPQISKEDLDDLLGTPSWRQEELRDAFRRGTEVDPVVEIEKMPESVGTGLGLGKD